MVRLPHADGGLPGRLLPEADAMCALSAVQMVLQRLLREADALRALPMLQKRLRQLLPETRALRGVAVVVEEAMLAVVRMQYLQIGRRLPASHRDGARPNRGIA